MPHHDHSHGAENLSDGRLVAAILLNLLLTVVELLGGVISGSLSLVADALHNFSDCGSLFIALVARRISRRPSDKRRTFGYRRAEVIGALINLTVLIVVGLYLVNEAIWRYFYPQEIEGWTVIAIACVALVVDVATAVLLIAMSHGNLNVRAAFLHNVSDALGSIGVIIVGAAVLLWQIYLLDVLVTLLIATYILWQSITMIRESIHILMESVPEDIDIDNVVEGLSNVEGVEDIHHVHIWQLDEHHRALEAHIVIRPALAEAMPTIKRQLKQWLNSVAGIRHSTLEFELGNEQFEDEHDKSIIAKH